MIGSAHNRAFGWLIGLLLFHLLLLSVQVRTEQGHLLLRSIGLTLLAPLASSIQFLTSSSSDFLDRYVFLMNAEREKRRLEEENKQLRLDLHQLRDLVALMPQTADFLALQASRSFETVPADVVGKAPPFVEFHLLINVGTGSGVRRDCAVITPEGIVGRVVSAGPFTAEVELVTNQLAAAGGRLERSRVEGVVLGDGVRFLQLDYIPISQPVEVGEPVVTSGTDRIYPRGIPIGTVESVSRGGPIYQTILVRPAVDLTRLEQVLVVVSPNRAGEGLASNPLQPKVLSGKEAKRQ